MNVFRTVFLLNLLASCTGLFLSQRPTDVDLPATDLAISPTSLNMVVSTSYTFAGTAGNPPYTYSIVSGSGSINASTGAFTAAASAGSVSIQVADSAGYTATASVVVSTLLTISPSSATAVLSSVHTFSGSGGQSPYTFSKISGEGSITAGGTYTAPSSVGTGSAVVQVSDSSGQTANASITVVNFTHLMFFTSTSYTPDQIGGLAGADTKCVTHASAAGLGTAWKALISISGTNASARVTISGAIGNLGGQQIASSSGDLFDGTLTNAVNYNESGAGPSGNAICTATATNGTYSAVGDCGAYTNQAGNNTNGVSNQTGAGWTNQGSSGCGTACRLYCISQ